MRVYFNIAISAVFFANCIAAQEYRTVNHFAAGSLIENFGSSLGAAEGSSARPLVPIGFDLIKYFEGWEPNAYNDPSGYCTIGYGHLIALNRCEDVDLGQFRGKTLTPDEGRSLLEKDTRYARLAVSKLVDQVDLTNDEFSAVSAFVFNIGETKFTDSTMRILLNSGDKESAATQFARWIRSNGIVLPGLKTRRACERTLFEEDLTYGENSKFTDTHCTSFGAAQETTDLVDIGQGE